MGLSGKAQAARGRGTGEWKTAAFVAGGLFVLMLLWTIFGPKQGDDDPAPTTFNSGSRGAKAAYLLLGNLGYKSERSQGPVADLSKVEAAGTTVIFTEPILPIKGREELRKQVDAFLRRGGRVVATGISGAALLPDGRTDKPTHVYEALCYTTPEGRGALALAGQVSIAEPARWAAQEPQYHVAERCGHDAVVVSYRVGEGEAVWWSSPMPLTNSGLEEDPSLKLLLASVGSPGRRVLFDEYLHERRDSLGGSLKGLPWWSLALQLALLGLLLVLSRGRRNGPLRMPVRVPRTSPVEFAESMGRLYERAGATEAATEAARGRLLDYLRDSCGMPREVLRAPGGGALAAALAERFGGDWSELEEHLEQARDLKDAAAKTALKVVQALERDHQRLEAQVSLRRREVMAGS